MTTEATTTAAAQPVRLPFPLQDSERVLELVRKHWIFLWPRTVLLALVALVPAIAVLVVFARQDWLEGTVGLVVGAVVLLWLLYWGVRALLNWYRFHHDIWVITNQRIVDSIKPNPFSHTLSTADLVNIQDMTVSRSGILPSLLNFGDIICETASDSRDFRLVGIPRPHDIQLLVDKERDRERTRGR